MALDHAALLEVLEAMKSSGVDERVKLAATTMYQALIDAELTAVVGAGPWERSPDMRGLFGSDVLKAFAPPRTGRLVPPTETKVRILDRAVWP